MNNRQNKFMTSEILFPEPAVEAAEAPEPKRNNFAGKTPSTLTQKAIHIMFT